MKRIFIVTSLILSGFSYGYECNSIISKKSYNLASKHVVTSSFIKHQEMDNGDKISYYGSFSNYSSNQSLDLEVDLIESGVFTEYRLVDIIGKETQTFTLGKYQISISCN